MKMGPVLLVSIAVSASTFVIGSWFTEPASAAGGERCTKTSTSCYDTVSHKARTCTTTTCTYADGHTTTSVSVELKAPTDGNTKGKIVVRKPETGAEQMNKIAPK